MKKINKISVLVGLIIFILALADLSIAQGKGYFFEKGNELTIPDNLFINGYLVVEKNLSPKTGLIGDVLVEKNFNLDSNANVYFCKDIKEGNKDCSQKLLIWKPDGNFNVIEPSLYQLQAREILGDQSLNIKAGTCNGCEIFTSSPVKIAGCLANDGGGTCNSAEPSGELKTGKMYVDFVGSLSSKTNGIIETIALHAGQLTFTDLNLGKAEDVEFQNNLTIGGLNKKPQQDLNNICWGVGLLDPCSGANGPVVTAVPAQTFQFPIFTFVNDELVLTGYTTITIKPAGWAVTSPASWTFSANGITDAGGFETGSAKLCCYLNITY